MRSRSHGSESSILCQMPAAPAKLIFFRAAFAQPHCQKRSNLGPSNESPSPGICPEYGPGQLAPAQRRRILLSASLLSFGTLSAGKKKNGKSENSRGFLWSGHSFPNWAMPGSRALGRGDVSSPDSAHRPPAPGCETRWGCPWLLRQPSGGTFSLNLCWGTVQPGRQATRAPHPRRALRARPAAPPPAAESGSGDVRRR